MASPRITPWSDGVFLKWWTYSLKISSYFGRALATYQQLVKLIFLLWCRHLSHCSCDTTRRIQVDYLRFIIVCLHTMTVGSCQITIGTRRDFGTNKHCCINKSFKEKLDFG